jgi:hypothetical protein
MLLECDIHVRMYVRFRLFNSRGFRLPLRIPISQQFNYVLMYDPFRRFKS